MKIVMNDIKKSINNKVFLSIIMSILTYIYLCSSNIIKAYDITSWLLFFAMIILYLKVDIFNKKLKKETIIFALLFSFIIIFGNICYTYQLDNKLNVFKELFKFSNLLNIIGIFNLLFIILKTILPKLYDYSLKKDKKFFKSKKNIFILSFIIIFICWIPYFLTFYPGTLSPDSLSELTTVIEGFKSVSDHHPVIHMLFIALPYNIGFKLFNSVSIGVAFSTLFQMITMASIFSSLIVFLYNRKVNKNILLLITLYYASVPMHGYYSIVMWKDVVFSGLLLLLTMETTKIVENINNNNLTCKKLISFIIISILCVFFRNNAIYMYMVLALLTLIIYRKYYKKFICVFLIVFGVYYFVKGPIFNYLNIAKSSSSEYIGMPLQQIGRMTFKEVEFDNNEKKLLNKLMPIDIMATAYNPKVSDGIKFNQNYHLDVFNKNKIGYLKLYLSLIKKHPSIALESYSISTLGYWYPGVEYWSVESGIIENGYGLSINSKTPNFIKRIIYYVEQRDIPILNIEWSIGLCFWIILIFGTISFKKNKLNGLYPYIPIFGIWLTMMIASPVYGEFRYVYGAFTSLPLLMLCPYLKLQR